MRTSSGESLCRPGVELVGDLLALPLLRGEDPLRQHPLVDAVVGQRVEHVVEHAPELLEASIGQRRTRSPRGPVALTDAPRGFRERVHRAEDHVDDQPPHRVGGRQGRVNDRDRHDQQDELGQEELPEERGAQNGPTPPVVGGGEVQARGEARSNHGPYVRRHEPKPGRRRDPPGATPRGAGGCA